MHLQQTKRGSRVTGGPQYYFHDLTKEVRTYLRTCKAVPVALMTPYGATPSSFMAVSKDFKLEEGQVVPGSVGHDRIQQAGGTASIGEAIRKWHNLPPGDFERIDVEIDIRDEKFYIAPIRYRLAGVSRFRDVERPQNPLSFVKGFQSRLWTKQLANVQGRNPQGFEWAIGEIRRIVRSYSKPVEPYIKEEDVLRASGPLNICGLQLGAYVGKGYDCKSEFRFLAYAPYEVPVELKKRSSGFRYQQQKYGKDELSRAVVLCIHHDLVNFPDRNIDVIELTALGEYSAS